MNGVWSEWEETVPCSMTCGYGHRVFTRACDAPAPRNGGSECDGETEKRVECGRPSCVLYCEYLFCALA